MFSNFKINKLFLVIIAGALILLGIFYGLLATFNYKKLYQDFYKSVKIDFQPQDFGHLQVTKFPLPILKVDNIIEKDKVELENLSIHFSLLSLLKMKPEIKILKIKNAKIYLSGADFNIGNHDQLIAEFIQKQAIDIDTDIAELTIINSDNKHKVVIKNFILDAENKDRIFSGELQNIGKFIGSFKTSSDHVDFKLNLNNAFYSLNIEEIYKDNLFLQGKAKIEISNFIGLISDNLPEMNVILSKNLTLEPVNINFNITAKDGAIKLSELQFNSNWFKGSGDLSISKDSATPINVKMNLSQIDLSSAKYNNNNLLKFNNKHSSLFIGGVVADVSIDQLSLPNGEKINNIKFISDSNNEATIVKDFSGQIASGGKFDLNGKITHNDFRSLFDGKLRLQHQDINNIFQIFGFEKPASVNPMPFTLITDLKCSLIDLYFNNINLKTDNTQVTGAFSAKLIGSLPRFNGLINFSSLDLNKFNYPVISPIYEYIKSLSENMKDKDYLNKFIPIRTSSYLGNFDITFNSLNIDKYKFDNVNLLLSIKDDQILLNNLYLNRGDDYLDLDLSLNVKNIKPKLDIKINDASLAFDYISPKALLNLRNDILNNYNLEKISLNWDCNFSKLYQKNSAIEKVKFRGENDSNLLLISELNANFLGGNFQGQGSILLDPYTINFVYALNSLDLSKLSNALPKGMLDVGGVASFNGTFTTNGDSLEKQLYNLYSKSNIIVKDVTLKNISVDDFITSVNSTNYDPKKLTDDLRNALLIGETKINSAKGELELTNGVTSIKNLNFQTNYASGSAAGNFDIYNFNIDFLSLLTFYVKEKTLGSSYSNRSTGKMGIKFTGSIFGPKKVADTAELIQILQTRKNIQN